MKIRIETSKGNPATKIADVELHFTDGPLANLKLIAFALWEQRAGAGRNVTFPARQYAVNGERRSFALLRPHTDSSATTALRDTISAAFDAYLADEADAREAFIDTLALDPTTLTIRVVPNASGNPPGKLADVELIFTDGALDGLKLIGFAIWERRNGSGRNVTFPARQYSVNGERRSFALLRPSTLDYTTDAVRDRILEAYAEFEAQEAAHA